MVVTVVGVMIVVSVGETDGFGGVSRAGSSNGTPQGPAHGAAPQGGMGLVCLHGPTFGGRGAPRGGSGPAEQYGAHHTAVHRYARGAWRDAPHTIDP